MRMPSSANLLAALLILVTLQLQPIVGLEDLLSHSCLATSSDFTKASEYSPNLKTLLKDLTSRSTLASTGFSMGSAGQPGPQQAFGLINCRPDISASDCKACGHQATKYAPRMCPGGQGAIVWYDSCLLKYSDSDFLGSVDTQDQFTMWGAGFSGDRARLSSTVEDLLGKLSKKAPANPTLFAKGKAKADSSTTVYGMVECTRDLSSADCATCLQQVVGGLDNCCYGLQGGRIISASCMFRFEIYPF